MTSCARSGGRSPASPAVTTIIKRWITLQIGCYVRSPSRIQWRGVAAPRKRLHRSIQVQKPDRSVHPDCYLQHHPALLQRRPVQWSRFHPAASGCNSRGSSGGSLEPVGLLKKRGYHTFKSFNFLCMLWITLAQHGVTQHLVNCMSTLHSFILNSNTGCYNIRCCVFHGVIVCG